MAGRARWWGPALVVVLALGALGSCGDDDGGGATADATTTSAPQGPGNPVTPAATFRTDLTALLHEHVYLVGLAAAGLDVGDALDDNTQDVADKVSSAFGTTVGGQFAELWGEHADQLVAGDTPTGFANEMQEFLSEHIGEDQAAEVAAELEAHVETASAAVAALTGGGGSGGRALRSAGASMDDLGATLSLILVEELALEGDAEAPAAELRVGLTDLLFQHVYLVGLATSDAPGSADATAALDANTAALAAVLGEVYDDEAESEFTRVWGAHADRLAAFAAGGGSSEQLEDSLDQFRADLGTLLEEVTEEELAAEVVAEELIPHVDTIIPAIEALQGGSGGGAEVREAAEVMASTAETFTTAFATALE